MTFGQLLVPLQSGGGGVALIALLFLVIWIGVLVWVHGDATSNSPHSAFLWTLVVFFGGLLGLVLYLIIGRSGSGGGPTRTQY